MKKNVITLAAFFCSSALFSQVGINTISPKATLDVVVKNPNGTITDREGLLIPRIDR